MGYLYKNSNGKIHWGDAIGHVSNDGYVYTSFQGEYAENRVGYVNQYGEIFRKLPDPAYYLGHVDGNGNIYNSRSEERSTCIAHIDEEGYIYDQPGAPWMGRDYSEMPGHRVCIAEGCTKAQAAAGYLLLYLKLHEKAEEQQSTYVPHSAKTNSSNRDAIAVAIFVIFTLLAFMQYGAIFGIFTGVIMGGALALYFSRR